MKNTSKFFFKVLPLLSLISVNTAWSQTALENVSALIECLDSQEKELIYQEKELTYRMHILNAKATKAKYQSDVAYQEGDINKGNELLNTSTVLVMRNIDSINLNTSLLNYGADVADLTTAIIYYKISLIYAPTFRDEGSIEYFIQTIKELDRNFSGITKEARKLEIKFALKNCIPQASKLLATN